MSGRVCAAIGAGRAAHDLHAPYPLLHEQVATSPLLGPGVLDTLFEFLAHASHRTAIILAALGVRVDQEQKLLADLAVAAGVSQPADLRVPQDSLDGDAARQLAPSVVTLTGVD